MSELDKAIVLVAQVLNLADILKCKKEVKPLFKMYVEYATKNLQEQIDAQVEPEVIELVEKKEEK